MKLIIINGPNLNLLGVREKEIYGGETFDSYFEKLKKMFATPSPLGRAGVGLEYFQSNVEGEIINKLHEVGFSFDGIILNAGGYTHTSVAIGDAIQSIKTPVVEVHISNVYAREEYRHHSFLSKNCRGIIVGFGLDSYKLAVESFLK